MTGRAAPVKAWEQCPICSSRRVCVNGPVRYGRNVRIGTQNASGVCAPLGRVWLTHCRSCGFAQVHPRVPSDVVLRLYNLGSEQMWSQESRDVAFRVREVNLRAPGRRILDIGCFTGRFLDLFDDSWLKFGIEPIPWAADGCRKSGICIVADTVEEWDPKPHSFDVVTMWDVVEHLDDVEAALRKSWTALVPGGLLAFETGNIASWFARAMGPDWWYVALPEHRSFLSPQSAKVLLDHCGFSNIEVVPTSWQSVGLFRIGVQLCKGAVYRIASLLSRVSRGALDAALAPLLSRTPPCILLRDHMLVFARKAS